jgi:IclR family pca regulon transcriptional regulator
LPISSEDPDFVNALARGLAVITAFGQQSEQMTLTEVAEKLELTRGTTRRFLLTLEALGYLRSDGKTFRLTPKTLDLGYAYLSSLPLWRTAQPIMQEVVNEIDESCSLGVLEDHDVVYIARIPPKHSTFIHVPPGTRMPAHLNAMGQVLLSGLSSTDLDQYLASAKLDAVTQYTLVEPQAIRKKIERVAKDGYAISDQQLEIGMRSIAVPVRSKNGHMEASINATVGGNRAGREDLIKRLLPVLRRAASQLAHAF